MSNCQQFDFEDPEDIYRHFDVFDEEDALAAFISSGAIDKQEIYYVVHLCENGDWGFLMEFDEFESIEYAEDFKNSDEEYESSRTWFHSAQRSNLTNQHFPILYFDFDSAQKVVDLIENNFSIKGCSNSFASVRALIFRSSEDENKFFLT